MRDTGHYDLDARLVRVTSALYRVTNLLPHGEPLRKILREKANTIFESVARRRLDEAEIQVMLGYLAIAQEFSEAGPVNFAVLEREYRAAFNLLAEHNAHERHTHREREHEVMDIFAAERAEKKLGSVEVPSLYRREQKTEAGLPTGSPASVGGTNGRQKEILERLTQMGQAKISDLYGAFPDISSKTIQRDLQDLVAKRLVKREGEKRWTTYMMLV